MSSVTGVEGVAPVDAIDLRRPQQLQSRHVVVPTADARHVRHGVEQFLAAAQLRLGGFGAVECALERDVGGLCFQRLGFGPALASIGSLLPAAQDGDDPQRENRERAVRERGPHVRIPLADDESRDGEHGADRGGDPHRRGALAELGHHYDDDVGDADRRAERHLQIDHEDRGRYAEDPQDAHAIADPAPSAAPAS